MRLGLQVPLICLLAVAALSLCARGDTPAASSAEQSVDVAPAAGQISGGAEQEVDVSAAASSSSSSEPAPPPAPPKPKPRAPGMWDEPSEAELPPPKRKLRVGITISIPDKPTSMYANGARQAAFYMYQALMYRDRHYAVMINLDRGEPGNLTDEWPVAGMDIVRWQPALDLNLDIVLELGMQMRQDQVDGFQKRGTKVVAYRSGNNYIMTVENMLYNRSLSTSYETINYDVLWTLPSFNRSSAWYNMVYRAPVAVAPYLWSPLFFDQVAHLLNERVYYEPRNHTEGGKTVAVFEPNINVVKTAVLPMSIMELLHRQQPGLILKGYITNAGDLAQQTELKKFVLNSLSLYQEGRLFFEKRYRFAWFLSTYTDVVLSHQWKNELNYLYLETLYAGYPLVHNSPYFKDCGYYYEGNDGYAGREALRRAILTHDNNLEEYTRKAKQCVWRHSIHNPANLLEWDRMMFELLDTPASEQQLKRLGLWNNETDTAIPYAQFIAEEQARKLQEKAEAAQSSAAAAAEPAAPVAADSVAELPTSTEFSFKAPSA